MKSPWILLASCLLLSACNGAATKPQVSGDSVDTSVAEQETDQAEANKPLIDTTPAASIKPSGVPLAVQPQSEPNQLDMLSNRLISVQEHLLHVKNQTSELQQVNRALLSRVQALQAQLNISDSSVNVGSADAGNDTGSLDAVLDQVTALVNEVGNQVQDGAFRVVTAYTAKGQWVLIRYHRYTGETWLADLGRWNLLEETTGTATSDYEVVLLRADKDAKGYVASRIDRVSGDTWWLNENTWKSYINN